MSDEENDVPPETFLCKKGGAKPKVSGDLRAKRASCNVTKQQRWIYVNMLTSYPAAKDNLTPTYGKAWAKIAEELDKIGPPVKTANEWITNFKNWEYSVRFKKRSIDKHAIGTGGGGPSQVKLTDLEEKALSEWGIYGVVGDPCIRKHGIRSSTSASATATSAISKDPNGIEDDMEDQIVYLREEENLDFSSVPGDSDVFGVLAANKIAHDFPPGASGGREVSQAGSSVLGKRGSDRSNNENSSLHQKRKRDSLDILSETLEKVASEARSRDERMQRDFSELTKAMTSLGRGTEKTGEALLMIAKKYCEKNE